MHISIEGMLLMLDDTTPHTAVPIQATRDGKVVATVLSDKEGKYRFTNLEPERYQVRCQVLNGFVYYRPMAKDERRTLEVSPNAMMDKEAWSLVVGRSSLKNIDLRFAPFKKGTWKNYTYLDGLADNNVMAIHRNPDGRMWFGTFGGGVSRYDGKEFVNLNTEDGLVSNSTHAIYQDPDGTMWFGTLEKEEVLIRVETHLKISRLTQELLQKNRELQGEAFGIFVRVVREYFLRRSICLP